MELNFYICPICGNIVSYVKRSGVKVICCGMEMQQIVANTVDGVHEKHLPVVNVEKNKVTVKVGSTEHPMLPEHYIEWVALQTSNGNQRKALKPGQKPVVEFYIQDGDKVEAVYEYCNIHGLWKV